MRQNRFLTKEEQNYIIEHCQDSPLTIARYLGCSKNAVYHWLNRYCPNIVSEREQERERRRNIVKDMYPTHSASEIAKLLGISRHSVLGIAQRLGVQHDATTNIRLKKENVAALLRPEVTAKRIALLRRTIKTEQFRINSGEPQRTKRKFKSVSNKSLCTRNYLVRAYNYFYDKDYGELLTIFYDKETRRLPLDREKYYSEKYHLKFEQGEE